MEFKPEYVRCTWSPELEGKEVCYSDSIDEIWQEVVNSKDRRTRCEKGRSVKYPFRCGTENWRFVYYDPNYSAKIAQEQGKKIECKRKGDAWEDWDYTPAPQWLDDHEYRIMQEEENPVTNKELALWLVRGNGQIYHHDDSGFRTEVKTFYIYHQDEDNCDCTVNKYLQCKIRKWGQTEWVTPTREYMGLEE